MKPVANQRGGKSLDFLPRYVGVAHHLHYLYALDKKYLLELLETELGGKIGYFIEGFSLVRDNPKPIEYRV